MVTEVDNSSAVLIYLEEPKTVWSLNCGPLLGY